MIQATQLKNGTTFLMDGSPYVVVKYSHQKIARGGGTVKIRARNLQTGSLEEKTLVSNVRVDEISTQKRPLQYLYNDGQSATFMDEKTFDQTQIPLEVLGDEIKFTKEGEIVNVLFWESTPLSIEIPPKVTLTITETDPGVKGNSASNMLKTAVLENGVTIKVPLFIKKGDKVRVDTRTSQYVERA